MNGKLAFLLAVQMATCLAFPSEDNQPALVQRDLGNSYGHWRNRRDAKDPLDSGLGGKPQTQIGNKSPKNSSSTGKPEHSGGKAPTKNLQPSGKGKNATSKGPILGGGFLNSTNNSTSVDGTTDSNNATAKIEARITKLEHKIADYKNKIKTAEKKLKDLKRKEKDSKSGKAKANSTDIEGDDEPSGTNFTSATKPGPKTKGGQSHNNTSIIGNPVDPSKKNSSHSNTGPGKKSATPVPPLF